MTVAGPLEGVTAEVMLTDAAGRRLATDLLPGGRLDLSGVPAGVYVLSMWTEAGVATHRLVVE